MKGDAYNNYKGKLKLSKLVTKIICNCTKANKNFDDITKNEICNYFYSQDNKNFQDTFFVNLD